MGSITLDMVRSPQPAHVHRFARGICIDLCACMYITFVSYRIVHYPSVCVAKLLSGLVDQNRSSSATWACSSVSCELEPSAVFIIVITSDTVVLLPPSDHELLLSLPSSSAQGYDVPEDVHPNLIARIRKNAFARLRVVKNRNTSQHLWIVFGFIWIVFGSV